MDDLFYLSVVVVIHEDNACTGVANRLMETLPNAQLQRAPSTKCYWDSQIVTCWVSRTEYVGN